jgi:hypothetical protein
MSAIGKNVFNIVLAVIVLFVAKHFLSDFGLKLYKMYYGVEGMTGNQKVPQKGTFISNEGRKWKNQIPFKVSENIYVFGGSDGGWFKMASVDSNGNFIENRYTNKCNSIDELTIDIWNSARRGGSYAVTDIILGPAAPAITELKSLERGATVYTGCGYTYSTKEDRDRQCGSGGTSKWIDDSNVINKLARGATVYTGCGYTYSTKEDRDRQCGSGGTSKWIDDRKPAPAQAAPTQAAALVAAPAQAAPAPAQAAPAPAQAAPPAPTQAAPVPVADTPMLIDATSCSGWDCNIEGQFCPKGVPGASAGNFLCKDNKWMQVDSRPTSLAAQASAATDEAKVADAAAQASQMHSDAQIATNEPTISPGASIGTWGGNNDSGVPQDSVASQAASSNLATQQIIPGSAYPSNTTVANISGVYPTQDSLNNIQGGNAQQTMAGVNTGMAPSPLAPTSSESVSKANDAISRNITGGDEQDAAIDISIKMKMSEHVAKNLVGNIPQYTNPQQYASGRTTGLDNNSYNPSYQSMPQKSLGATYDNRLGGNYPSYSYNTQNNAGTAYTDQYKPVNPGKKPKPYNSLMDLFR